MRTGRPSHAQTDDPDCWQQLANAIVTQAAYDYRHDLKKLRSHPGDPVSLRDKTDVEEFMHSRWFSILTEADGDYILRRLREEAASDQRVKYERKSDQRVKYERKLDQRVKYERKTRKTKTGNSAMEDNR